MISESEYCPSIMLFCYHVALRLNKTSVVRIIVENIYTTFEVYLKWYELSIFDLNRHNLSLSYRRITPKKAFLSGVYVITCKSI